MPHEKPRDGICQAFPDGAKKNTVDPRLVFTAVWRTLHNEDIRDVIETATKEKEMVALVPKAVDNLLKSITRGIGIV
ncbi:MAG: hypothetical protein JXL20_02145 [Deltaproteobacteria bacterium]|nr:hypothetical protein [Deltaproteobacteria bacterium]